MRQSHGARSDAERWARIERLYHEALARANKELGRVSGQLATKNRRLAIRAKFFDALSGFHGEIRADAPPQTILQAIGQTAVSVLEATSVATFSLAPANNFAEVMLFDSAGDLFENSIVDCHDRPPDSPRVYLLFQIHTPPILRWEYPC
jgi:hypothetical protein